MLKVEGKERSGSGHQSNQLILNTLPFFKLNAQFAVETDNLQVTQNLEAFARNRDTPQTFWQECESSEGMSTSAAVARSYLCIQATSTESERLLSKRGLVLSPLRTNLSVTTFAISFFSTALRKI